MTSSFRAFQDPDEIVRVLEHSTKLKADVDLSQEALIYISLALISLRRLKKIQSELFEINNREIATPWLEKAFREVIYIRQRQRPELTTQKSNWPIKLTRFGRIDDSSSIDMV